MNRVRKSSTSDCTASSNDEIGSSESPGRIRVVHFIGKLIPGGVERRTLELIEQTSSHNLEHFVCVTSGETGTLDSEYEAAGAGIEYLNIRSPLFPLHLIRFLRRIHADVTHSNLANTSGFISFLAFLSGVPNRITHYRSDENSRQRDLLGRVKHRILRMLINKFSTQIVGLTPQNLALAWTPQWDLDPRCSIVPNGVSPSAREGGVPADIAAFLSETLIIHAGRADLPTKNRGKAISVFADYHKLNPQSRLLFIGRDGRDAAQAASQRKDWENLAHQLKVFDRVHFLGEKTDPFSYFFHADGLLFTSTLEGLPGVVLEALSAGLPVVSSRLPGTEYISEHNNYIHILDVSDADREWAATLQSVIPGKLNALDRSRNAQLFGSSLFHLEAAVERYCKLWRRHQLR